MLIKCGDGIGLQGAPGEDHLVRSTGFVTSAVYSTPGTIRYVTYNERSTEWLQLGACAPTEVTAGGVKLQRVSGSGNNNNDNNNAMGANAGWWSYQAPGGHGDLIVFKSAATTVVVMCA